jgi:dTMP kinase
MSIAPTRPTGRGCLIAFCGLDGSGKTTQMELARRDLEAWGVEVVMTRQPSDWYRRDETVRAYLDEGKGRGAKNIEHELALFAAADRLRHIRTVIDPAVERGAVVLTDRYVYSSYAYFAARGLQEGLPWLQEINSLAPDPDAVFLLDVPAPVAVERVLRRGGAKLKYEERRIEIFEEVRCQLLDQPWGKNDFYHVIDGQLETGHIHDQIMKVLDAVVKSPSLGFALYWRRSLLKKGP